MTLVASFRRGVTGTASRQPRGIRWAARRVRTAILVVLLVALAGCGWPQFRGSPALTGSSPDTGIGLDNVASLTGQWSFEPTQYSPLNPPAVVGNVAYFTSYDGQPGRPTGAGVYAVDLATGTVIWGGHTSGDANFSAPAVVDGTVYYNDRGALVALDAATGTTRWTAGDHLLGTFGYPGSPPTVANGTVYISITHHLPVNPLQIQGTVIALDAATGTRKWSWDTSPQGHVLGAPAVANGTVYIDSSDGMLALDATTGAVRWSADIRSGYMSPAVANGTVYVATAGRLHALDATTGSERWSFTADGYPEAAVANGTVYAAASNNVYALDATTGSMQWSFAAREPRTPTVANGVVYIATSNSDSATIALDAADGTFRWSTATTTPYNLPPVVAYGRLITVGHTRATVFAPCNCADPVDTRAPS